ncbi:MAG: Gfo/Idh/MocA family oxidoreductase [Nitrospirae bacterium]|nr:Gfo/Idh/MocA family oxidoreductase [Nitrospirota bacterium]
MTQIQIGIVGAGEITRLVHLPVLKNYGAVRVGWIADRDVQRVRNLGGAFGVARQIVLDGDILLPPCDIALVATPVYARRPYLEYFGALGNAVLTEKPFALSTADHHDYLSLCANSRIHCGYMRRTYATVRALRRMVREQWFGRLRSVRYSEGGRVAKSAGASKTLDMSYRKGGGVLRDLGCHGLDVILWITGAAHFQVQTSEIEWDHETDRQVVSEVMLSESEHLESECLVQFSVSWLSEQTNRMVFEFDHASVRAGIRPDEGVEVASLRQKQGWTGLSLDIAGARSNYQAFYLEWQDVVDACQERRQGELSAASSLLTTRLVDEVYRVGGGR